MMHRRLNVPFDIARKSTKLVEQNVLCPVLSQDQRMRVGDVVEIPSAEMFTIGEDDNLGTELSVIARIVVR